MTRQPKNNPTYIALGFVCYQLALFLLIQKKSQKLSLGLRNNMYGKF